MDTVLNLGKVRYPLLEYKFSYDPVIYTRTNNEGVEVLELSFAFRIVNEFNYQVPEGFTLMFKVSGYMYQSGYHSDATICSKEFEYADGEAWDGEYYSGKIFSSIPVHILLGEKSQVSGKDNPYTIQIVPFMRSSEVYEAEVPMLPYTTTCTLSNSSEVKVDGDTIIVNQDGELQSNYYSSCFPNLRLENGHLYADYPDGVDFDVDLNSGCKYLGNLELNTGSDTWSILNEYKLNNISVSQAIIESKGDLCVVSKLNSDYNTELFRLACIEDPQSLSTVKYIFKCEVFLDTKYLIVEINKQSKELVSIVEKIVLQEVQGTSLITKLGNSVNTDMKAKYYFFENALFTGFETVKNDLAN